MNGPPHHWWLVVGVEEDKGGDEEDAEGDDQGGPVGVDEGLLLVRAHGEMVNERAVGLEVRRSKPWGYPPFLL